MKQQSSSATIIAKWVHQLSTIPEGQEIDGVKGGVVTKVWHGSLQEKTEGFDPMDQMEGGWNATFALLVGNAEWAKKVPYLLKKFTVSLTHV